MCDKSKKDKNKNINLVLNDKFVLPLTKEHLVKCSEDSQTCEFNIKYNPKVNRFDLGVEILKNLNIYFMKNENSVKRYRIIWMWFEWCHTKSIWKKS